MFSERFGAADGQITVVRARRLDGAGRVGLEPGRRDGGVPVQHGHAGRHRQRPRRQPDRARGRRDAEGAPAAGAGPARDAAVGDPPRQHAEARARRRGDPAARPGLLPPSAVRRRPRRLRRRARSSTSCACRTTSCPAGARRARMRRAPERPDVALPHRRRRPRAVRAPAVSAEDRAVPGRPAADQGVRAALHRHGEGVPQGEPAVRRLPDHAGRRGRDGGRASRPRSRTSARSRASSTGTCRSSASCTSRRRASRASRSATRTLRRRPGS